ncbi:MAG: 1-acyl-sn-glycerol-3-phosphate acyltransferase [Bacteroidaceae bacterium]|nr:1-acyl-sn-glycerol-3-phosphate acyltransferase [Bacteroidaceae bacterium]
MIGGRLSRFILQKWMGFTVDVRVPLPPKFIAALAPHTSNVDFMIGQLYSRSINTPINFMMKREWFFWPLGILLRRMGGIPINRSKHEGLTDQIARKAMEMDEFRLCITPEGTRKATTEWKRGFYYIALKAGLPILLYGLDYERKLIACYETFIPTGDYEADMAKIKKYFCQFKGKYPERFAV